MKHPISPDTSGLYEKIWNFVNKYAEFNRYTNSPIAKYKNQIYNLPFNMNTFHQLWNVKTPKEAIQKMSKLSKTFEKQSYSVLL